MATKVWVGGDGSAPSAWDEAANWSPSGVPGAGADVVIPATAEYGIDGYNASSTALNSFKIQTGYAETIGDSETNLHIALTGQPDREVVLAGTAQQFLDIDGAARITVIEAASAQAQNDYGCNIVGEANDAIYVQCTSAGNSVGIAGRPGTSCAVDAIAISGGAVTIGEGVVDSDSDTDPDIHSLQMSGGLVECSGTVTQ